MAWLRTLVRVTDLWLFGVVLALLAISWTMLVSAGPERVESLQSHIALALSLMLLTAVIPLRHIVRISPMLYLLGVLLLIAVALFGDVSKGARRWLDIGVARIQPSELMKLAVPLALAWYFQQRENALRAHDFLIAFVLLGIPVGLIAMQPDLGTALLVTAAGLYVIFFAGLSWKLIIPAMLLAAGGLLAIIGFGDILCAPEFDWVVLHEYQKQRICTLLDPSQDPLGRGFHVIQSTIAIGSGGMWGKGWLQGTQTHLAFIPERHTDFIFSVLCEEFGFVGVLVLIALYVLLIGRGMTITITATTFAGRLLAGAVTMIFFTYAFVNMGMVSGILPVVGVPLPFISYGGTALVSLCIAVG
ncbi:MAG: rod shape-determining protein RodA, partial [Rhodocyclaceae bacterium]|nr:rod shape-determining protein RodA [Rhodocyclaceae bacterium]